MLSLTQYLIFEIGTTCQLGKMHHKCPNTHPDRFAHLDTSRELDDNTVIESIVAAYKCFGFDGLVGFHYYNEPTLNTPRILRIMESVSSKVDNARFVLWSNGVVEQSAEVIARFSQVYITPYPDDWNGQQLDDRMSRRPSQGHKPCLRVFTEFVLDAYGNHHPCCFDWRGEASLGNVFVDGFDGLVVKWRAMQEAIGGCKMTDAAPAACLACGFRPDSITPLDNGARRRAEQWRETQARCR